MDIDLFGLNWEQVCSESGAIGAKTRTKISKTEDPVIQIVFWGKQASNLVMAPKTLVMLLIEVFKLWISIELSSGSITPPITWHPQALNSSHTSLPPNHTNSTSLRSFSALSSCSAYVIYYILLHSERFNPMWVR